MASDASAADFLAEVPMFSGIDGSLRAELAGHASEVELPAGEWLFRQGQPGDALYVLRSGRLEVVAESPGEAETLVRVLNRGAVLGELALLTASVRSASVRARRDSVLLRLARDDFVALLGRAPEFALAVTRVLGAQLQASRARTIESAARPTLITVTALHAGAAVGDLCTRLEQALGGWGAVARLDGTFGGGEGGTVALAAELDRCERTHDQVLLEAAHPDPAHPWTAFCLRQADRVLAVADPATRVPATVDPRLSGCDLVLWPWTEGTGAAAPWLDAIDPRTTHIVRAGDDGAVERIARRLAGRSIGAVLSGGGARGFAHIGVLEELEAAGLVVDRVGGCSMGAFVGAMFAAGYSPDEMHRRCREEFVENNPLNDYTLPLASLVRGRKAEAMLHRTYQERTIEELEREYFCVSCDLISSALVVHRRGPLWESVGASICLPGIGAPVASDGRLLVDGGVLNNLPVEQMAKSGEGPVIAVDVTARFQPPEVADSRFTRPKLRELEARARSWVIGRDDPLPSFKETLVRTIVLGSIDTAEAAQRHADLIVIPDVSAIGLLDFHQIDRIREAGREAARAALGDARSLVS